MDIVVLIKAIVVLVVLLALLIVVFFYIPAQKAKKERAKKRAKAKKEQKAPRNNKEFTLEELIAVIRNKKSSQEDLKEALDRILKYYGTIHPKLGTRPHPDFDYYAEIFLKLCNHPNTTTALIVNFDKELEKRNPTYKKEINTALTKGLNARGV